MYLIFICVASVAFCFGTYGEKQIWDEVPCKTQINPDNCNFNEIPIINVADYERCAPAKLPLYVRNYFLGRSGRGLTYKENRKAFDRIRIKPNMLQDMSYTSLKITTMDHTIDFPVGIGPTARQELANSEGAIASAKAAAAMNTIMVLSAYSSKTIENVALHAMAVSPGAILWMQVQIFKNITYTIDMVQRAERSGYKVIVLTCDSPVYTPISCNANAVPGIADIRLANIPETYRSLSKVPTTFDDINWLKSITNLPIVAKGILNGEDAVKAILAGASAIVVSNHGGRLLDGAQGSIDALSGVVEAVSKLVPRPDVYLDSGVRSGVDVFKALAIGAKMVFIGRPVMWGLTLGGEDGVRRVLTILKEEFNRTMILAGIPVQKTQQIVLLYLQNIIEVFWHVLLNTDS